MSVQESSQFSPSRVIVLAELSTREKEKYYEILFSNKVKFHRDEEGRYIASVRLLAPGLKKEVDIKKTLTGGNSIAATTIPLEVRLNRLKQKGPVSVKIIGTTEPFDYRPYLRFTAIIAVNGDTVKPKTQSLSWLMKKIELLYDSRFEYEKMDVERDDELSMADALVKVFPIFVFKNMSTVVGLLKALVDQTCWDLLYNTHIYRNDFLEVEIFARFLQEFYDNDDLLFYLYVRSVVMKVLQVSFKTRWAKADGPGRPQIWPSDPRPAMPRY